MGEEPDRVQELLLRELRGAVNAKIDRGADPNDVTADLTERLHRVRQMLLNQVTAWPQPPAESGQPA